MPAHEPADSGLYQLVIRLRKPHRIRIGRLGTFSFPAGYYVYTGSARRGLESRISRHLRRRKRMRWHIDYLLEHGLVIGVNRHRGTGGGLSECRLNRTVRDLPSSRLSVHRFGSSDCRCSTHLFHFRRNPARKLVVRVRRSASKNLREDAPAAPPPRRLSP